MHADGYAEVLGGLTAGEMVVVSANFLIDAESNLKAAIGGFGHHAPIFAPDREQARPGTSDAARAPIHHGNGSVEAMDWAHAKVTITHDPIASLNWPAMTMDFRVADPALLQPLKPGQEVEFELVEESAGEYVIVRIHRAGTRSAASPNSSNHGGH
jgi:Cu(I)/Ag(I) efflux system membrane fusion protein